MSNLFKLVTPWLNLINRIHFSDQIPAEKNHVRSLRNMFPFSQAHFLNVKQYFLKCIWTKSAILINILTDSFKKTKSSLFIEIKSVILMNNLTDSFKKPKSSLFIEIKSVILMNNLTDSEEGKHLRLGEPTLPSRLECRLYQYDEEAQ